MRVSSPERQLEASALSRRPSKRRTSPGKKVPERMDIKRRE